MSRITQDMLDKVAGLPSREAASILGVGRTSINKYREIARLNGGTLPIGDSPSHKVIHKGESSSVETRPDGGLNVETQDEVPQTKDQVDEAMRKRGFDPEQYDFSYRFAEWQANVGGGEMVTMYAARASATPKRAVAHAEALDVTELLDAVRDWSFTPVIKDEFASADMAVGFADPQLGKTDENGGSNETVNQIMGSYAALVEIAKEEKPHDILFADLGDGLENFNNTAQQRETNDLDLTSQVRVLRRLQMEGIKMLRPHCKRLIHASVPSNHGSVRVGFQQQASTVSNDWGLEVSHQLEDVFRSAGVDVDFLRPDGKHSVSLSVFLENNSTIGLTHGDQSAQAQMGNWWMRQAFGWLNPLRDADLLMYGHHHNQALEEVSEGRWAIGCASSDRGSAWFTNRTGHSATSGITTFMTAAAKFWGLALV